MAKKKKTDKDKPAAKKAETSSKAASTSKSPTPAKKNSTKASPKVSPRLRKEPVVADVIDTSAHKFDLAATQQEPSKDYVPAYEHIGDLPDTYGTYKLFLTARDPYYLFAYWDLTTDQMNDAQSRAHDHKLFLQIYKTDGTQVHQIHIHPGQRQWHIHANQPDTTFYAEMGYYQHDGGFKVVTRSGYATAPRDTLSWKTHADFVTIPFHFTFRQLRELINHLALPGEELAETLARLEAVGHPFPFEVFVRRFLPQGAHDAMLDYLKGDIVRRINMGSFEITEIIKRHLRDNINSEQWVSSLSSPFGASFGGQRERNFFMHVNAELIIYGGTDPKAKVRIDGEPIQLRPDGTFSYHFKFSDGKYFIPITAESPDQVENRSAMLSFMRLTDTTGQVDATPQPPLPDPLGKMK